MVTAMVVRPPGREDLTEQFSIATLKTLLANNQDSQTGVLQRHAATQHPGKGAEKYPA
jgi:hypothetical protein